MNWEKILGLDVEKLYQSFNWFFYLFLLYCIITIASSYRQSNELIIPIGFKTDLFEEGIWQNDSVDEFYKIPAPKSGHFEVKVTTEKYSKALLASKFSQLLHFFAIGFVLWQVRGLAKTIKDKIPFDKKNIKRIRSIGFAFFLLGTVPSFTGKYVANLAKNYIEIPNLELTATPQDSDLYYLYGCYILCTIFLLIAHVFKKGIELQEENALTI